MDLSNTASELYNELLEIYFDEYGNFSGAKRKKMGSKYNPANLIHMIYRCQLLLAQIKVGNNSYKLKSEIGQILYLLYQHNEVTKTLRNNVINTL